MVKNPPAILETWVWSLGWEDPLEEVMATHSSILAWRIPMDSPLAGYSPCGCRVGHDRATKHTYNDWEGYSNDFGERMEISRGWATTHFLGFDGQPWNCHGTCGCVIELSATISKCWGSGLHGSWLIAILDPFGSNQFILCPWAVPFFSSLCPAHFLPVSMLRYYMCVLSGSVMSNSLWLYGLKPARFLCAWNFLDKNTGVGCHFLLQGIFPTLGSTSPASPALAGEFFTTEPPRSCKGKKKII